MVVLQQAVVVQAVLVVAVLPTVLLKTELLTQVAAVVPTHTMPLAQAVQELLLLDTQQHKEK